MRFFILVTLLVVIVVAVFYMFILPVILTPQKEIVFPGNGEDEPKLTQKELKKLHAELYDKITKSGEMEDLKKYASTFPKGIHIEEILYKLAKIGDVRDCEIFLKRFPSSKSYLEIKRRYTELKNKKPERPTPEALGIPEPGPVILEEEKDYPEKWTNPKDDSEMLLVRAGTFTRGSEFSRNRGAEKPEMYIYVSSFYVDKYAIMHEQYQKFIDDGGYTTPEYWSKHGLLYINNHKITEPEFWDDQDDITAPVVGISWFEAEAYCRWSGKMMLSEVQWEKAARGYYGQRFPWGDKWNPAACNWKDPNIYNPGDTMLGMQDGFIGLAPVYMYKDFASPFGAVQMSGNCYEWVLDHWNAKYFSDVVDNNKKLSRDPLNIESHKYRVLKGGTYELDENHCEPSWRHADFPERRSRTYGFRCCKRADLVYKEYRESLMPGDSPEDDDDE